MHTAKETNYEMKTKRNTFSLVSDVDNTCFLKYRVKNF